MICNKCNVDIKCKTEICPLCQSRLGDDEETINEYKKTKRAFPKRKKKRPPNSSKFDMLYFYLAVGLSIVSFTVNLIVSPSILWSLVVIASLIYLYFLVRNTIMAPKKFCGKILGQATVLTVVIIAVEIMLGGKVNLYAYALPIVFLVSQSIVGIFIISNRSKSTRYLVPLLTMGILGVIPFIVALINNLKTIWPSLAVGAISIVIISITIILEHKSLGQELKRIFHL